MELADLAPARVRGALLAWAVGGVVLAGVEVALRPAPAPPPPLVVDVPAEATEVEVEARVREALLLDTAHRLGWARTDPVVARILEEAMSVAVPASSSSERLDAALALGLDLTEPTVRARLLDRGERALAAVDEVPDDATLAAWQRAHPERFVVPPRHRVELVAGGARPQDTLEALAAGREVPLGELAAGGRRVEEGTVAQLAARFGPEVALVAGTTSSAAWTGPWATPAGPVLVRVTGTTPAVETPLSQVRGRVLADWRAAEAARLGASRWAALRASRVVQVVRR